MIDPDGTNLGVLPLAEAQDRAAELGLQLVQVAGGDVPVCRIADPGKLAYEAAKAAKQRKARQQRTHEVKLRPQTGDADIATKLRHIRRFLDAGDQVRVVVMLRGRQIHRDGDADQVIERLRDELAGTATIDGPHRAGRDVRLTLRPAR